MKSLPTNLGTVTKAVGLVAAASWMLVAAPASALFTGDVLNATYFYPTATSVYQNLGSQTPNPTATFVFSNGIKAVANPSNIALFLNPNTFGTAAFNGAVFTDLTQSNIIGVSLDGSSNLAGFDASRLTFTSNSISFNLQGLSNIPQSFIKANVQFGTGLGAVPEPATWAMLLVGFGGIGVAARSRRFKKSVTP